MSGLSTLRGELSKPGKASFAFADQANPDRPLVLHAYRPAGWRADDPVVLVQHGMLRNGADYRDFWVPVADRCGLLVLAIEFPGEHWPRYLAYNDGLVRDASERLRPATSWAYTVPARIVGALRADGTIGAGPVRLFGHSAGGQFVHRLVGTIGPGPFTATIAANAGWYSAPTLELPFPEGLGGIGLDEAALDRWLGWPLTILAGDRDTETEGDTLPSHEAARRQGPHRFARARHFVEAGHATAARRSIACGWRLIEVPGVGHDGAAMSVAAALWWFAGRLPEPTDGGLVVRLPDPAL